MRGKAKAQVIKIDEEGRYLLIIQTKTPEEFHGIDLWRIGQDIDEWWASGKKFGGLSILGAEIKLERIVEPPCAPISQKEHLNSIFTAKVSSPPKGKEIITTPPTW